MVTHHWEHLWKLWHLLSTPEDLGGDDEAGPSAKEKRGRVLLDLAERSLSHLGAWSETGVSEL